MAQRRQLRNFDQKRIDGVERLIGVDEAGRGALAGPVVAAAVEITREFLDGRWAVSKGGRVNDSKQLSAEQREALAAEFEQLAVAGEIRFAHAEVPVAEIEQHNILGATKIAMQRALEQLHPPAAFRKQQEPDLFSDPQEMASYAPPVSARILIDGLPLKGFAYPHEALQQGDARSLCIAMASIIAKVARDRRMDELALKHPGYGFERHKGYGTPEHMEAVLNLGRCHEHRDRFLRKLFGKVRDSKGQLVFFTDEEIGMAGEEG